MCLDHDHDAFALQSSMHMPKHASSPPQVSSAHCPHHPKPCCWPRRLSRPSRTFLRPNRSQAQSMTSLSVTAGRAQDTAAGVSSDSKHREHACALTDARKLTDQAAQFQAQQAQGAGTSALTRKGEAYAALAMVASNVICRSVSSQCKAR